MPDVVDRLGAALLDASLAATAITGLVVLAMLQCRQPARRRVWARAALLSTLALLPLAALNPVPRIDLQTPLRSILSPRHFVPPNRPQHRQEVPDPPAVVGPGPSRPGCEEVAGPAPGGPRWLRWISRGLVFTYGAGVSIGLGSVFLGIWGSAWVVRRGRFPSPATGRHYRSLPFDGRSARPRLLISDRVGRPVLLGILRSSILIPRDLDEPDSADRLRLSLLHELAHAEDDDHRYGPAATLAQAIWFFLPPVWWIRDQMKLDQEFLADRRAVAHFGTSGGYASSLVDLASSSVGGPVQGPAPVVARPVSAGPRVASALFQRVQMLLKCPFAIEGETPLWWRWSTAMTLTLATLAASCLTLRGLAGWSEASPRPVEDVARSFRLPQLVIGQREHDDQPFGLRFRLPDEFNLTFEVMAEPSDLPSMEVLGHRLGPTSLLDPTRQVYRLWHRVQIRRVDGSEAVQVDDRPVLSNPKTTRLAPWLTIRPLPGQTTRIRDLQLDW
jgi:bla regulator protein blaR1